jgi:hypothetical protein
MILSVFGQMAGLNAIVMEIEYAGLGRYDIGSTSALLWTVQEKYEQIMKGNDTFQFVFFYKL